MSETSEHAKVGERYLPYSMRLLTVISVLFALGTVPRTSALDNCPDDKKSYTVAVNEQITGDMPQVSATCSSVSFELSSAQSSYGSLSFAGTTFTFQALSLPATSPFTATAKCNGVDLCVIHLVFYITKAASTTTVGSTTSSTTVLPITTAVPPVTTPTVTPTSVPTTTTTTTAPPTSTVPLSSTPTPTIGWCLSNPRIFTGIYVGQQYTKVLSSPELTCPDLSFSVASFPSCGSFGLTGATTFMYTAPTTPSVCNATVLASCGGVLQCRLQISLAVTAFPTCATNQVLYTDVYVGQSYSKMLSSPELSCTDLSFAVSTPPTLGSLAIVGGTSFIFLPPTSPASAVATVTAMCGGAPTCQIMLGFIVSSAPPSVPTTTTTTAPPTSTVLPSSTPTPTIGWCLSNPQIFADIYVGQQYTKVLSSPELTCADLSFSVASFPSCGSLGLIDSTTFMYIAPALPSLCNATVLASCGGVLQCKLQAFFSVQATPVTAGPATTLPPALQCTSDMYSFVASIGTPLLGTFNISASQYLAGCSITSYSLVPSASSLTGSFTVNTRGDYLYVPPATEVLDRARVNVMCWMDLRCSIDVYIQVYKSLTLPPTQAPTASPSPTPKPVIPACPMVYYYDAQINQVRSGTLRSASGQAPCDIERTYSLVSTTTQGALELMNTGAFWYTAPAVESLDQFTFDMFCTSTRVCRGVAYIVTSRYVATMPPATTPLPSGATFPPTTQTPIVRPTFVPTQYLTCRGTCSANAWKAVPALPNMWDDTRDESGGFSHITPRKDGNSPNGIDVRWLGGNLVIEVYGLVGNVAARFPTFEPVEWRFGEMFTGTEQTARISATSPGFNASCLDQQSRWGMGEEVWKWISLSNKTGTVGPRYATGSSWYHKFGGKHINCDTFALPCRYAPLLTPRETQLVDGGVWSVDVDDCDVTWRGAFSQKALMNQRKRNGDSVWLWTDGYHLQTTIYTEAVKPNSWLEPALGVATETTGFLTMLGLSEFVRAQKRVTQNQFSADAEYFRYVDPNTGDFGFGVNLLIFPFVAAGSTQTFSADRHVRGFRWISQRWSAPTPQQCTSCKGTKTVCDASNDVPESLFVADVFPVGDCPGTTPLLQLFKGPSMTTNDCLANRAHEFGKAGFSAPYACSTSFQNLTIRGLAVGSGAMNVSTMPFAFEGQISIELLMSNGRRSIVDVNISLFVGSLARSTRVDGSLAICRTSPYWPVLDPLGNSISTRPFRLSSVAASDVLCVDTMDKQFGLSGWAVIMLAIPSLPTGIDVRVDSLYIQYTGVPRIYFVQGSAAIDVSATDTANSVLWSVSYPFFNFRPINLALNNSLSGASGTSMPTGVRYAFAFTPGVGNTEKDVEIVLTVQLSRANPNGTTTNMGTATFREFVRVDPLLTTETRFGLLTTTVTEAPKKATDTTLMALAALSGLAFVVLASGVIFMFSDSERPLPKWVPRAKLIRRTILSVVPKPLKQLSRFGKKADEKAAQQNKSYSSPLHKMTEDVV